jgi:hypothetical protein
VPREEERKKKKACVLRGTGMCGHLEMRTGKQERLEYWLGRNRREEKGCS